MRSGVSGLDGGGQHRDALYFLTLVIGWTVMKNAIVTCERTRGVIRSSYSFLNFFEERAAKPPGLSHASALGHLWEVSWM